MCPWENTNVAISGFIISLFISLPTHIVFFHHHRAIEAQLYRLLGGYELFLIPPIYLFPNQQKNKVDPRSPPKMNIAAQDEKDNYALAIQYTCENFETGANIAEIHRSLRSNGYHSPERATVEEWLRVNGLSATSQTDHRRYVYILPALAIYKSDNREPDGHQPDGRKGKIYRSKRGPPHYPSAPWDAQADRYTMKAHLDRKDWIRLLDELTEFGYYPHCEDIHESLSKQGV